MATTPGHRLSEEIRELSDGHGTQISPFSRTHGDGLQFNLPISNNQEIGNLEQSMLADFKADLLVSQVRLGTKPALSEAFFDLQRKIGLLVGDIQDNGLGWCEPGRESPFVMLDQDRKSTRLNSSHIQKSRMPSSA